MLLELLLGVLLHVAPYDAYHSLPAVPVVDSIAVEAFGQDRAGFDVLFGEEQNAYRVMAMFVLPGETVPVTVVPPHSGSGYQLTGAAGLARPVRDGVWTWTAPGRPGLYPVEIRELGSDARMTLNVFVMVPYGSMHAGRLNGYRIGRYPASRKPSYAAPAGFVEVQPGMEDIAVSPHFRLGQFLCKQVGGPNKYLVLRQPLLLKLERLLAQVNDRGIEAGTFHLMSAYRTPFYNAAIGNITTLSRHHYGDAADIFVDEDGDGRMDDLNHDGRHTVADARWLGKIVNETQHEPEFGGLLGGLGLYQPTGAHGAFVHVDVRGFEARWGS